MRILADAEILRLWEQGQSQHPLDRLLTILLAGLPGKSRQELADLSIGDRDRLLLDFRENHFGEMLQAYGVCPACRARLEFSLETAQLRLGEMPERNGEEFSLTLSGCELTYRLPTSRDLAAAAALADLQEARELVLRRCLVGASQNGTPSSLEDLPEEVVSDLIEALSRQDPQADISLAMHCPECGHLWEILFDIGLFVWTDLMLAARRLVREVHILASAYGWSEAEILSLPPARRQAYLDLVLA
ncbi:MAG: phage baseplate protein [Deltaproteobacteria bacterium]|nr:phage baseplate protein [Deltaproteobacteria bacterium]